MGRVVKRKTAAKHIYATNSFAYHRIVWAAILIRRAAVGSIRIHRVAFLKPEQATPRLNSGKKICRRECERTQAECVRGIGPRIPFQLAIVAASVQSAPQGMSLSALIFAARRKMF